MIRFYYVYLLFCLMKFFLSFVAVLVAILLFERFFPASAPINPVLPIGPQVEVSGHGADVPLGPGAPVGPGPGAPAAPPK